MFVSAFEKVISMSLIGSYIIGVVLLVRLLLCKCERKYSYFLWFVVFFNLCLPISIQAPISLIPRRVVEVAQLPDSKEVATAESTQSTTQIEQDLVNVIPLPKDQMLTELQQSADFVSSENVIQVQLPEEASGEAQIEQKPVVMPQEVQEMENTEKRSWQSVLAGAWLLGIGIIWGISGVQILRLNDRLKKAFHGNVNQEGVVCIEGIGSPFLWGFLKPIIYLPMDLEETEKEYIIAHESYHKKRRDYISKAFVFAVVSIHWFNPFVWIAYALFCKDMEISCDEAVLSHYEEKINKQYAASLLKYAAKQNGFVLTPLTFGEPSVKSRIQNALRYKKGSIVVTVLAVCVVSLTACGLLVRTEEKKAEGPVASNGFEQEQDKQQENNAPTVENSQIPEGTSKPEAEGTAGEPNERGEIILVQEDDYREVKVLWEDLDGNGQQEYILVQSEVHSARLTVYVNEEPVYVHESPDISINGIHQKEYLDLDNDGEKEIFISFEPRVNSRPLEEWFVLKQTDSGWQVMEQYHTEEGSGIDNAFPITVTLYKKPYELVIACEGFDKKIYYDATRHYEEMKYDRLSTDNPSDWLENRDYEEGDVIGGTEAWGIWEMEVSEYEGQNCLIAQHGIIGIVTGWDSYGTAYVYFNYDANGKIQILDMVFREYVSDKTIIATTEPAVSSTQEVVLTSEAPLEHSNIEDVTQYTGVVPAYHTSKPSFQKWDGSVKCKIDWMKLSDELILEDLIFDFTMDFIEKKVLLGSILDVFYDEEANTVSVLVNAYKSNLSEGYHEVTWLIQFSTINPQVVTKVAYDTQGVWFGEVKYVNDCFYLHSGAGSLPYEIDPHALSRDGRSCESEYQRALRTASEFMENLKATQGIETAISWFTVIGEKNGMTIYQGLVQEEMDTPVLAYVYVATKDGEIVDSWLVESGSTQKPSETEIGANTAYHYEIGDFGKYNVSFELNGFVYRFLTNMNIDDMKLIIEPETEEERYGYKIKVSPVCITAGIRKELLGVMHGTRFYVQSDTYIEPSYAEATKQACRIMSADENGMSVYRAKEVDRDTYTEFMNNSTEETYYEFAEEIEFIMLDSEFRSTPVTYERFQTIRESKGIATSFYYFFEKDGKIVQIWEPYTP